MSRLPKVEDKPKNNKSTKFRWVDMQWERFMTRHDEDTKIIKQLQDDLVTCNKFFHPSSLSSGIYVSVSSGQNLLFGVKALFGLPLNETKSS